jgi:hypothetical protein
MDFLKRIIPLNVAPEKETSSLLLVVLNVFARVVIAQRAGLTRLGKCDQKLRHYFFADYQDNFRTITHEKTSLLDYGYIIDGFEGKVNRKVVN